MRVPFLEGIYSRSCSWQQAPESPPPLQSLIPHLRCKYLIKARVDLDAEERFLCVAQGLPTRAAGFAYLSSIVSQCKGSKSQTHKSLHLTEHAVSSISFTIGCLHRLLPSAALRPGHQQTDAAALGGQQWTCGFPWIQKHILTSLALGKASMHMCPVGT